MQAIITKFIPCTNTKPDRIKAFCEAKSLTITWPYGMETEEAHIHAATLLCKVLDWNVKLHTGYNSKIGYVHVLESTK